MAFLVDDILLAPVHLVVWVGEKLKEAARSEMTDESKLRGELLELQIRLETEEITEEEFLRREREVMEGLEAISRYKGDNHG